MNRGEAPESLGDTNYIATQVQTLADSRGRRPRAAPNRAHPDAVEIQEEPDHAQSQ